MSVVQHELRDFLGSAMDFTMVGSKIVKLQSSKMRVRALWILVSTIDPVEESVNCRYYPAAIPQGHRYNRLGLACVCQPTRGRSCMKYEDKRKLTRGHFLGREIRNLSCFISPFFLKGGVAIAVRLMLIGW
jgi:hypothetical protein